MQPLKGKKSHFFLVKGKISIFPSFFRLFGQKTQKILKNHQFSLDFDQKTGALAANVKIWLNINFSLDKKIEKILGFLLQLTPLRVKFSRGDFH